MKFKKDSKGGVAVELGPEETRFAVTEAPLPAFRLKNILVPVDFSECSNKAIQYAVPFAKQFGAEVLLLHLVEPYPLVPEMAPVDIENFQDAKKQMEDCQHAVPSIPVKTLVRVGEALRGSSKRQKSSASI